jgi:hypothetical protein
MGDDAFSFAGISLYLFRCLHHNILLCYSKVDTVLYRMWMCCLRHWPCLFHCRKKCMLFV